MTLPAWWPKALLVVAALFLLWRHDAGQRAEGALRQQIHAREETVAALARRARVVDTAYLHDTVTFTKFRTRLDTLLVDQRITDTVWVKALIVTADSTVRACEKSMVTCARRVDIRDSIIREKDALLTLERKRRAGFRFLGIPLGCTVGGVASSRGVQPGIGCGIRLTR